MVFINALLYVLLGALCVGSLLPLSRSPHWFIRGWDFPRVQIVLLAWLIVAAFAISNLYTSPFPSAGLIVIVVTACLLSAWHLFRIIPYTKLFSTQVKAIESRNIKASVGEASNSRRLRIVMSNVQQENDQKDRWKEVILDADADVVIAAEIDRSWRDAFDQIKDAYPHQVIRAQENWYGMAMLSRLPIIHHKIRFLVQDDIPSIDAMVELPSREKVRVIGVHPRPPEPLRDNDSAARDGELALWGKALSDERGPIVIGGDLNDVAWSRTTRLFLRLSHLLDPRRGRGFFNSFHADHIWMRFPLDHVFHSTHFLLRNLRRLAHVGSDHFPILIDLQLQPQEKSEQEPLEEKNVDRVEAGKRIQRAEDADDTKSEPNVPRSPSEVSS